MSGTLSKEMDPHPGEQTYDGLMAILENSAAEQEKTLARILSLNGETEYLRQYKLNGATDAKTFKEKVPVSDYDNYKPFMDRILEGDTSPLLTGNPVTQIWTSSGTSKGAPKMFAGTDEELVQRARITNYSDTVSARAMPEMEISKVLMFFWMRKSTFSPGGLPCHPISTAASYKAYTQSLRTNLVLTNTSPPEVCMAEDHNESMYCHLLLGLLQREEVGKLVFPFPPILLRAMRTLGDCWPHLRKDIASGSLSTIHVKEEKLRSAMQPRLQKRPDLADYLEGVLSATDPWSGILRKLWPNAKLVDTPLSGTMKPYFHTVIEYAGDLPVICSLMYVSTEGSHGMNLDMMRPGNGTSYNFFPGCVYYEFIAVGDDGPIPEVLGLESLQEGQEYEMLITTLSGLCRYRMGEVLKVVGFHKSSPTFQIVRRSSVLLSVDMDKTDEAELNAAVEQGSQLLRQKLGWRLADYTSTTDYESQPGHYVIFWELDAPSTEALEKNPSPMQQRVLEECCAAMEAALGRIYRRGRQENVVGALELRVVQKGTFDRLCSDAVERGVSAGQFKTPRGLAPESPYLRTMLADVIQSAFSKSKPPL